MSDIKAQMRGMQSNTAGKLFEEMLSASCHYYQEKGAAIIEKTPEPLRPLKPYGDRRFGQYIACFIKKARPDYKGVLCDGSAVIFEAKHTDKDRILESAITEAQRNILDGFQQLKAKCFVMVSMGFRSFYRVPWEVFSDMKWHYGRKYMTEKELEKYKLKQKNGIILILEGVELNDN